MASIVATPHPASGGVTLTLTFSPSVTAVKLGRVDPSGYTQLIRQGDTVALIGGNAVVWDYEAPLDVDIRYTATQATPAPSPPPGEQATSNTIQLASDGYSWLKDPGLPSRNFRIPYLTSISELTLAARQAVFPIVNRTNPVVVSQMRLGVTASVVMTTETDSERTQLYTLFSPGSVLLLQTPGAYGWGTRYVGVGDVVESRIGLAMEPARTWTFDVTVTDRPAGLAQAGVGIRWDDVRNTYPTWDNLYLTGKSWNNVLEGA